MLLDIGVVLDASRTLMMALPLAIICDMESIGGLLYLHVLDE